MNMLSPGELQPFKLRIEDYDLLDGAGAFQGRRVELIDGVVFEVSPQKRSHSFPKNEIAYRLRRALETMASPPSPMLYAQTEPTVAAPPHGAPEPDVVLTTEPRGQGYIPVGTLALAVEIADTTLQSDLHAKKALYAEAAVPEYWVVDVNAHRLHQFWGPQDAGYAESRVIPFAGELWSATIPDLVIDGSGIL